MRAVIVGHGPSLKGAKKGELIDSHDFVVRIKLGPKLCSTNPKDYGTKLNAVVASTEVLGCFKPYLGRYVCWAYPKRGWYEESDVRKIPVYIPLNLCNRWNWIFQEMGARHPRVSTGMAAVIITAHEVRPEVINLAGFDTLLDPSKEFTRITEVPRTGIGNFPDHDWETENKLLKDVEKVYGVEIKPL